MSGTANRTLPEIVLDEHIPRWFGEPVSVASGFPSELAKLIPNFDRRPFSMGTFTSAPATVSETLISKGENKLCDLIVRKPLNGSECEIPVGVVSKNYKLVQHTDLFEMACKAVRSVSIDPEHVSAKLVLSTYGSKMSLALDLPKKFDFDPGDGHTMKLQFHCVNSVNGQCQLRIMLGWFRLICGNGLMVGTAQRLSQGFIHNEDLEVPDLTQVLAEGLKSAEQEKTWFNNWIGMLIKESDLDEWADGAVRGEWGPLAAARVHLICITGHDGRFASPGEKAPPHRKRMIRTTSVPGAPPKAGNAYHVAQALAWVARSRRDIQDQLDGMMAIPKLMRALLN